MHLEQTTDVFIHIVSMLFSEENREMYMEIGSDEEEDPLFDLFSTIWFRLLNL